MRKSGGQVVGKVPKSWELSRLRASPAWSTARGAQDIQAVQEAIQARAEATHTVSSLHHRHRTLSLSILLLSLLISFTSLPPRILPPPSHTWSIDHRFRFTHPALPLSSVEDAGGAVEGAYAAAQVGRGGG